MNEDIRISTPKSFESFLMDEQILSFDFLAIIHREMRKQKASFEKILSSLHVISETRLTALLSEFSGLPIVDISNSDFLLEEIEPLVSSELSSHFTWVPFKKEGNVLHIAVAEPSKKREINSITRQLSLFDCLFYVAPFSQIEAKFQERSKESLSLEALFSMLENSSSNLPSLASAELIPRIFRKCLEEGTKKEASDIHFEPESKFIRIRLRIDGHLYPYYSFHKDFWDTLCVHLKVCAQLNIAENRFPQSGRFSRKIYGEIADFRISTHPTKHGESVVIRILDRKKSLFPLEELGFSPLTISRIKGTTQTKQGLFIIVGPTGSGKTTTLYSILSHLKYKDSNIMTLEQPIEYDIPFIRQTEIHEGSLFTFANGIRSSLRQDPDILLIGEIRDSDTAQMAIRAAMTGHQIYTTLHSPRALMSFQRLEDLGVSLTTLTNNLKGVLSQRLLRKLCLSCRKKRIIRPHEVTVLKTLSNQVLYDSNGCDKCNNTGFKGRVPIVEFISCTSTFNQLVLEKAPLPVLEKEARKTGYIPIPEQGINHVLNGDTSLDELVLTISIEETYYDSLYL